MKQKNKRTNIRLNPGNFTRPAAFTSGAGSDNNIRLNPGNFTPAGRSAHVLFDLRSRLAGSVLGAAIFFTGFGAEALAQSPGRQSLDPPQAQAAAQAAASAPAAASGAQAAASAQPAAQAAAPAQAPAPASVPAPDKALSQDAVPALVAADQYLNKISGSVAHQFETIDFGAELGSPDTIVKDVGNYVAIKIGEKATYLPMPNAKHARILAKLLKTGSYRVVLMPQVENGYQTGLIIMVGKIGASHFIDARMLVAKVMQDKDFLNEAKESETFFDRLPQLLEQKDHLGTAVYMMCGFIPAMSVGVAWQVDFEMGYRPRGFSKPKVCAFMGASALLVGNFILRATANTDLFTDFPSILAAISQNQNLPTDEEYLKAVTVTDQKNVAQADLGSKAAPVQEKKDSSSEAKK